MTSRCKPAIKRAPVAQVCIWTLEVSLPACHPEQGGVLLSCRASAAGQREGGRDRWKTKAPVVCRSGEVAGAGAESAQDLGPGPSSCPPAFFLSHAQPLWPLPFPYPVGVIISSVRCGCFLRSIVCRPCPSPVPVCAPPSAMYAPCPYPTLIIYIYKYLYDAL